MAHLSHYAAIREILELVPDVVFEYHFRPAPGFVFVTPSVTALLSYTPDELYADPELGRRIVHPDDRCLLEEAATVPDECRTYRIRWRTRAGADVPTEQRLRVVRADGAPIGFVGVSRPVAPERSQWAIEVGDVRIDLALQRASVDGRDAMLTPSERQILTTLASANRTLSRHEIVERLWGRYHESGERAVEVHISNLRKKLETDPHHPVRLITVRGVGYRLVGVREYDAFGGHAGRHDDGQNVQTSGTRNTATTKKRPRNGNPKRQ